MPLDEKRLPTRRDDNPIPSFRTDGIAYRCRGWAAMALGLDFLGCRTWLRPNGPRCSSIPIENQRKRPSGNMHPTGT